MAEQKAHIFNYNLVIDQDTNSALVKSLNSEQVARAWNTHSRVSSQEKALPECRPAR
jgi:hypothetical protein